jgi:hypothetical protein
MTTQIRNALDKADSLLPVFDTQNPKKRKYLSYRLCGFSRTEAQRLCKIPHPTVTSWMALDARFSEIEHMGIMNLSKEFRKEVISMEFTRTMRLMMQHDADLIEKQLVSGYLTKDEKEYLVKIRPLYSPASLKVLEDMLTDKSGEANSWSEMLIIARKGESGSNADPYKEATRQVQKAEKYLHALPSGEEEFKESPGWVEDDSAGTGTEEVQEWLSEEQEQEWIREQVERMEGQQQEWN